MEGGLYMRREYVMVDTAFITKASRWAGLRHFIDGDETHALAIAE